MKENTMPSSPQTQQEDEARLVIIKAVMAEATVGRQIYLDLRITCHFPCQVSLYRTDARGHGIQALDLFTPAHHRFQWESFCAIDEILTLFVEIPPSDNSKDAGPHDRCFLQITPQGTTGHHQLTCRYIDNQELHTEFRLIVTSTDPMAPQDVDALTLPWLHYQ